jgi:hypothetical protein
VGILNDAMKQLVEQQRLGWVATVRGDGAPHLSPEGTLAVWDDDTLVFADIASRETALHLLENPAVEVAVLDPQAGAGWRFRGQARLLLSGPTFDRLAAFYRERGVAGVVHHMVLVGVETASQLAPRADGRSATVDGGR